MKDKIKPLIEARDTFIENNGKELFNKIVNLKKELSKLIHSEMACEKRQCAIESSNKFYQYYKCCSVCEKTFGGFRASKLFDIIEEDFETSKLTKFNESNGFLNYTIGCKLNPEDRSFTCITFHCSKTIPNTKCKILIGLYSNLIMQYKDGIEKDTEISKSLISSIVEHISNTFDKIKNQKDELDPYLAQFSFYEKIKELK